LQFARQPLTGTSQQQIGGGEHTAGQPCAVAQYQEKRDHRNQEKK